ncbi:MAG TPA: response regulator transcription factor [Anaerolineae bacterium]|nr:response regulator transcription factor [Anaerolineae bacterium]
MRILLADGRPKVRFALRALLTRQTAPHVVQEASDAQDLLTQAEASCPDLILLDWELPGLGPSDLIPALRRTCPKAAVIALSCGVSARREALAAGVDAFVSKGDPPERLLSTIDGCAQTGSAQRNSDD